jgi:hypothetical protein
MTVYTVTTTTQFNTAIGSAVAGDRIEIATNTALSNLSISTKNFGAGITITSASGYDAVLDSITVSNTVGITFEDVAFHRVLGPDGYDWVNAGTFTNCHNITVHNCDVYSSRDNDFENDVDGLEFSGGSNLTVTNTEFTDVQHGVIVANAEDMVISGNVTHHLGGDAYNFANVRDVLVSNNLGYDWGAIVGFHRDFIQFWTVLGYTPSDNVEIRGNVLLSPDVAVQGIYIDSDNTQSFYDFLVTENLIVTQAPQGIWLMPAQDSVISYNTVIAGQGNNSAATIRVAGEPDAANYALNVSVINNIAPAISLDPTGTNVTGSGNQIIQFVNPNAPLYAGDLFLDALDGSSVNDFRLVPGGPRWPMSPPRLRARPRRC